MNMQCFHSVARKAIANLKKSASSGSVRETRRIQYCISGLVVIFSVVAVSTWLTAAGINTAIEEASSSSRLHQTYSRAATSVHALELIERDYYTRPGAPAKENYEYHIGILVDAFEQVSQKASAADLIIISDLKKNISAYNAALHRLFEAIDRGDANAASKIDAEEADPLFDTIEKRIILVSAPHQANQDNALNTVHRLQADAMVYLPLITVAGFILMALLMRILHNIRHELQKHQHNVEHATHHDALTGLANRRGLEDKLMRIVQSTQDDDKACALFLIDLDRFHDVNDVLGHQAGDQLLTLVGQRLAEHAGPGNTVARLGGDEFAILLPGINNADAALAFAKCVQKCLVAEFELGDASLELEASIGIALSGAPGNDRLSLFQQSDIAMHRAKQQKCGIAFYDLEIDHRSPRELSLLGELRRGIENNELFLQYQPKINIASGKLCGVEALVRWKHPRLGVVPPNEFVPLAERTGLIKPMTMWVIEAALKQARNWIMQGQPIQIAINVSARNLNDPEFAPHVLRLLEHNDVPPALILLEITESAVMVEPECVADLLGNLYGLGINISIDDFGAGYTSLAQLKTLPINELKIDMSFVQEIASSQKSALIVRSMIGLGHSLNMKVVAEGVEDLVTAEMLRGFGCDAAQGYFFSRPLSPDNISSFTVEYTTETQANAFVCATALSK